MKRFKTNRKGYFKFLLAASFTLPLLILLLNGWSNLIAIGLTLIPSSILLWIYYGTYYIVENEKLFYRSAFVTGHVDVNKIRKIIKGRTTWIGLKPATATKGLLIEFGTYDQIYISPENSDSLIEALKEINDKIAVTEFPQ